MYTGTFFYKPADRERIHDTSKKPSHICPDHHQIELNLISWRLSVSEVALSYGDTEKVMILEKHNLPWYFPDFLAKLTTKTFYTLVWFSDDFCLFLLYKTS